MTGVLLLLVLANIFLVRSASTPQDIELPPLEHIFWVQNATQEDFKNVLNQRVPFLVKSATGKLKYPWDTNFLETIVKDENVNVMLYDGAIISLRRLVRIRESAEENWGDWGDNTRSTVSNNSDNSNSWDTLDGGSGNAFTDDGFGDWEDNFNTNPPAPHTALAKAENFVDEENPWGDDDGFGTQPRLKQQSTDSSDGWGTPAAFVNVQSNSQVNENDDKMLEFAFGSEASKSSSRVASKSGNPFLDFM